MRAYKSFIFEPKIDSIRLYTDREDSLRIVLLFFCVVADKSFVYIQLGFQNAHV